MVRKNFTSDQGVPAGDNPDSLTDGQHGPVLFLNVHLIEKQELMV